MKSYLWILISYYIPDVTPERQKKKSLQLCLCVFLYFVENINTWFFVCLCYICVKKKFLKKQKLDWREKDTHYAWIIVVGCWKIFLKQDLVSICLNFLRFSMPFLFAIFAMCVCRLFVNIWWENCWLGGEFECQMRETLLVQHVLILCALRFHQIKLDFLSQTAFCFYYRSLNINLQ